MTFTPDDRKLLKAFRVRPDDAPEAVVSATLWARLREDHDRLTHLLTDERKQNNALTAALSAAEGEVMKLRKRGNGQRRLLAVFVALLMAGIIAAVRGWVL